MQKENGAVKKRPPIVVVVGHVDHGKTTLLDYIRKLSHAANGVGGNGPRSVAEREAGGITQSIGAYEIVHPSASSGQVGAAVEKITFIDTPGHEAFSKMRERGAKIADIAILVVAADDGVEPQTKEAINILTDSKTHFVVAINKVDKAGEAGIMKTKNELTAAGVLLEGYGGSVSFQEISAKTGQGVSELLDLILLAADVEHLSYDPTQAGEGVILEAKRDSRRGVTVTAIVTDGTIRIGDRIASVNAGGQVKALEDSSGKRIARAEPSAPVLILGFEEVPAVGAAFRTGEAAGITAASPAVPKPAPARVSELEAGNKEEMNILRVMLKADVVGSLEALTEIVSHLPLPKNVTFKVMETGIGEITDGDIQHAISTGSIMVGFRADITKAADNLAKAHRVKMFMSDIVYELVKSLELEIKVLGGEELVGELEILAVFGKKDDAQVIGGRVIKGVVKKNASFRVMRGVDRITEGRIVNLQQMRKDAAEVKEGNECGLLVKAEKDIRVGDRLMFV